MEAGWQYAPLTFRVSAVSILQDRHALIIVRQPPKASRSYLSTPPTPPSLHQQRITTHPQQSRSTHQLYLSTPSNRSTRWTGQTCLTNSQAANHERWMVRCSPRAPGFCREQITLYLATLLDFSMIFSFFLGIGVNQSQCFFLLYYFSSQIETN